MPDRKIHPGGKGGKQRAYAIDDLVTATVGPNKGLPDGGSPPARARRQPSQPSSYAPSGERPTSLVFGVPMQGPEGKARKIK